MQAWSDQGERNLVRVDCAEADFRTFETALYQVFFTQDNKKRTMRMVQQVQSQRRFEAWHLDDQRITSHRSSAYAALISNISEHDRAKDAEQLDDIFWNFINETNKYEGRFGNIRDEGKILAAKKNAC